MTTNIYDSHGVLVERWDNDLRVHYTYAPSGAVLSEVPYTPEENAAADATAARFAVEANAEAIRAAARGYLDSLRTSIEAVRPILDKNNNQIGGADIKVVVRNLIDVTQAVRGSLRLILGAFDSVD